MPDQQVVQHCQKMIGRYATLRFIALFLQGVASIALLWAGIKHVAKAPVVSTPVLVALFAAPVVLWLLVEYLGHLKGKHQRRMARELGWIPEPPETRP